MKKDELFEELLHVIQDLASFAPYAHGGASEEMLRSKMRFAGERLIRAAGEGGAINENIK